MSVLSSSAKSSREEGKMFSHHKQKREGGYSIYSPSNAATPLVRTDSEKSVDKEVLHECLLKLEDANTDLNFRRCCVERACHHHDNGEKFKKWIEAEIAVSLSFDEAQNLLKYIRLHSWGNIVIQDNTLLDKMFETPSALSYPAWYANIDNMIVRNHFRNSLEMLKDKSNSRTLRVSTSVDAAESVPDSRSPPNSLEKLQRKYFSQPRLAQNCVLEEISPSSKNCSPSLRSFPHSQNKMNSRLKTGNEKRIPKSVFSYGLSRNSKESLKDFDLSGEYSPIQMGCLKDAPMRSPPLGDNIEAFASTSPLQKKSKLNFDSFPCDVAGKSMYRSNSEIDFNEYSPSLYDGAETPLVLKKANKKCIRMSVRIPTVTKNE